MIKQKILDKLFDFFNGTKCVCCGEMTSDSRLCGCCGNQLARELRARCAVCGECARECTCVPELLRMSYFKGVLFAGFYNKKAGRSGALNRIIYNAKSDIDRHSIDFLSELLAKRLADSGINLRGYIFTYPPRRRDKVDETGIDQAKYLAQTTAKLLDMPFETTLRRSAEYDGAEQKSLGANMRLLNMEYAFEPAKKSDIEGKNYIIVDDIITTGATQFCAAECLRQRGACDIIALAVARTAETAEDGADKKFINPY